MSQPRLTVTHWGNYLVERKNDGQHSVRPTLQDPEPSPIGRSLADSQDRNSRVAQPMVRLGLTTKMAAPAMRRNEAASRSPRSVSNWIGDSHRPMVQPNSAILALSFDEAQRIYSPTPAAGATPCTGLRGSPGQCRQRRPQARRSEFDNGRHFILHQDSR